MMDNERPPKFEIDDFVKIVNNGRDVPGNSYAKRCALGKTGTITVVSHLTQKGYFYKLSCDERWWHEQALKTEKTIQVTECEFMELLNG